MILISGTYECAQYCIKYKKDIFKEAYLKFFELSLLIF